LRRLVLLDSALANLVEIARYISKMSKNRAIGQRFANDLRSKCTQLAALPGTLGRPRPEIRPDLRSFPYKGYIIFFRYLPDSFEVVNILEGHRDLPTYFTENLPTDD
jgi:plasmid stabilization system protein ParE